MKTKTPVRNVVLGIVGLAWLVPIYLLIVNASKPASEYGGSSPWAPTATFGLFENLQQAWVRGGMGHAVLSTAAYAIVGPGLAVIIGAAAGFAIAALRLRHAFGWFVVIFGGTVVPLQMLLMPLFTGYSYTSLYNTHLGMFIVYTALCVPFSAFVMRNFMGGIAYHVFEAAIVDGAGPMRIFLRIYLPMSAPALVAVFILQATIIWNDLLVGMTLSMSDTVRPLMPALTSLQSTYGGSALPVVLAGGLLVSIPTTILFLSTQRVFSSGLALGQY